MEGPILEGLTFDDVLLVPGKSSVLPTEVNTQTQLTRKISLNIPLVSAAMDTVTESRLAIAMARQGGLGFVHRSMSIDRQAEEVDRVKRSESGMIVDPVTISPELTVREAMDIMTKYRVSGLPVTRGARLVGILTNRDLRFEKNLDQPVSAVMTKDNLVTVSVGTTLEEAERLLQKHRIEKLLVVDADFNLKGLITVKDIQKKLEFPSAAKDGQGRLLVGAAIGATGDFLERAVDLARTKVDVLAIDTAHGHSARVMEAIRAVKHRLPEMQLIAGNVGTYEGARDLIALGIDGIKVGIGPGSICTTRVVTGAGVPQITAILEAARAAKGHRRAGDRGRRHQVFGRHQQGHRGGRGGHDARRIICGDGGISRRNDSLSRAHVQIVSRDGLARRDAGGFGGGRPLRAGRRGAREIRAGGRRRARALQGLAQRAGRSARGRAQERNGLLRRGHAGGIAGARALCAHHGRGAARKPRARRDHHARSAELPGRIVAALDPREELAAGHRLGLPDFHSFDGYIFQRAHFRFIIPVLHWLFPHASAETLELMHAVIRKSAHLTEYFIFSIFLMRGLRGKERGWKLRWAIWAIADRGGIRVARRISSIVCAQPDRVAVGCAARYGGRFGRADCLWLWNLKKGRR